MSAALYIELQQHPDLELTDAWFRHIYDTHYLLTECAHMDDAEAARLVVLAACDVQVGDKNGKHLRRLIELMHVMKADLEVEIQQQCREINAIIDDAKGGNDG